MALEIERKFLTTRDTWRAQAERTVRMAQGYLNDLGAVESGRQRASVRVRIAGEEAFLNLKSRDAGRHRHPASGDTSASMHVGHTRQEFDYPIPVADAEALLALCTGGLIDKQRHYVRHAGHLWEVDEFLGDNAGLVVAEIELRSADEAFERPDWLGAEVTELQRYYNLALAERPYAHWTDEERRACS